MSKSKTKNVIPTDGSSTYNFIWRSKGDKWPILTQQTLITTHNGQELELADLCQTAKALGNDFILIPRISYEGMPARSYNIDAEKWSEAKEKAKLLLKEHILNEITLLQNLTEVL